LLGALLIAGCTGQRSTDPASLPSLDDMPLLLARSYLESFELVDYYELAQEDGVVSEALAVSTLRRPLEKSYIGASRVVLFSQYGGEWALVDGRDLDGGNATTDLRDMTGDGTPEIVVFTSKTDLQQGDFAAPMSLVDYAYVFAVTQDVRLAQIGAFSSTMRGSLRTHTDLADWGKQSAIQVKQDLRPAGSALFQPYRVESFAWDGEQFASIQVKERRRISPSVLWGLQENAPWAAAFLVLGAAVTFAAIALARRIGAEEKGFVLGAAALIIVGGIVLQITQEYLCTPGLVMVGLVGLLVGWRVPRRPDKAPAPVERGE
jgi:hypothetical protein